MGVANKTLGTVENIENAEKTVSVSGALLILGGAAVGAFIGLQIGGPTGTAVGALVGAFVGALAAGLVKNFEVIWHKDGKVEVRYETRFA